ncbi:MAG: thioredoxin family protein [bacterium]
MRLNGLTLTPLMAAAALAVVSTSPAKPTMKASVAPDEGTRSAPAVPAAPMAAVAEIGADAPDFALKDTDGKEHRLSDLVTQGKTVVLEWFNPDCPFVRKHHEKNHDMVQTYESFRDKNVVWLAVNSAAPGKQGFGADRNKTARQQYGMEYPVLLDEKGEVGRLYGAKTTPHMFVISKGKLVYEGAIDDNPSPGTLGKTNYVAKALDAVLTGKSVEVAETKSYGCSVKYGAATP